MSRDPLSLEDLCYLHLILHLEEYLPEELSLLSLRVRERLLVNLPAADICKLEETTVVHGVDMNGVWKKVGQRQIKRDYYCVCSSTLEALDRGEGYRDHFHEVVSHNVVWENSGNEVPLLLYSVMECLGVSDWQSRKAVPIVATDYCYPKHIAVLPPCYEQHFKEDSYDLKSCALMLFSCFKMLPRKLTINSSMPSHQYTFADETTLRMLLSEVEEFQIRSYYNSPSETLCGLLRRDTQRFNVPNTFIQCSSSRLNCIKVTLNRHSYDPSNWEELLSHGNVPQENECLSHSTFIMVKKLDVSIELSEYRYQNALLRDITQAVKYQVRLEDLLISVKFKFDV